MKPDTHSNILAPCIVLLYLVILLLVLVFSPNSPQLTHPKTVVRAAPVVVRHSPTPVLHRVRGIRP